MGAMRNVLSTKLAQFTYAQIIDGLPIEDVAWDQRIPAVYGNHPIEHHPELCPGALEFALEYKDKLDFELLSFPRELTTKYVQSTPGSKVFNTRLIELVAMALNEIGGLLFDVGIEVHQGTGDRSTEVITHWKQDPDDETLPTMFHHPYYLHCDIYPLGVSNLVGYWAEDRILGDVVTLIGRLKNRILLSRRTSTLFLAGRGLRLGTGSCWIVNRKGWLIFS